MKKTYSLIKASMTSDMSLIKINGKKNNKLVAFAIVLILMLSIGASSSSYFKELAPTHMQYILLSIMALGVSVMTLIEGIYKSSSLLFNCKDDQLLLSLPIKRKTILFIRIFKFYIFELLFNSLLLLPFMIAYIYWAENLTWTYFLTSFLMLLFLPIIPIIISCIIGFIISSLSNRFKYKNAFQTIISFMFILGMLYLSSNSERFLSYLIRNTHSVNELIMKIYYPAGLYGKLVLNFNIRDLIIFLFGNLFIIILSIFILSKCYFKINSRAKIVVKNRKLNVINLKIKEKSIKRSFIKKELNTFFNIPVFIVNSGFALILFIIIVIAISLRFDSIIQLLSSGNGINISRGLILNNISVFVFGLVSLTSYMTSISNSLISLEGRNINLLKTLPLHPKTILTSKIYSCLIITTPILFLGNIILFIRLKISILELILLLILSILIPLVSHFVGLIINLKFPKLDAANNAEVVKQSMSSFLSVALGMLLLIITFFIIGNIIGKVNSLSILIYATLIYLTIDIILYIYLITKGVDDFNKLSI